MRVYLPATLATLRRHLAAGEVGPPPVTAFAVTPALREWYVEGDLEELEYAALSEAARACLHLLALDPGAPPRRVVLAADVEDAAATVRSDLGRAVVRLDATVPLRRVVSAHVDAADAEPDVRAAADAVHAADLGDDDAQFLLDGVEDHELLWYAAGEIPRLVG